MQLTKQKGWLTPLSEGEVLVVPPGFLVMQMCTSESWGMRWGVHFPECSSAVRQMLGAVILAHPTLAGQGYESFRQHLEKESAAAATPGAP